MEAVAFRVEGDLAGRPKTMRDLGEIGSGFDPA
jgi:hypothetical protein